MNPTPHSRNAPHSRFFVLFVISPTRRRRRRPLPLPRILNHGWRRVVTDGYGGLKMKLPRRCFWT
jgi:hypothetical protein